MQEDLGVGVCKTQGGTAVFAYLVAVGAGAMEDAHLVGEEAAADREVARHACDVLYFTEQ